MGDSMKNLTVMRKLTAEECIKETDKADDLIFKKFTKNDLDASVVNAFSMGRHLAFDKTDY